MEERESCMWCLPVCLDVLGTIEESYTRQDGNRTADEEGKHQAIAVGEIEFLGKYVRHLREDKN